MFPLPPAHLRRSLPPPHLHLPKETCLYILKIYLYGLRRRKLRWCGFRMEVALRFRHFRCDWDSEFASYWYNSVGDRLIIYVGDEAPAAFVHHRLTRCNVLETDLLWEIDAPESADKAANEERRLFRNYDPRTLIVDPALAHVSGAFATDEA